MTKSQLTVLLCSHLWFYLCYLPSYAVCSNHLTKLARLRFDIPETGRMWNSGNIMDFSLVHLFLYTPQTFPAPLRTVTVIYPLTRSSRTSWISCIKLRNLGNCLSVLSPMGLEEMRSLAGRGDKEMHYLKLECYLCRINVTFFFFLLVAGIKEQCMHILDTLDWNWHPQECISSCCLREKYSHLGRSDSKWN